MLKAHLKNLYRLSSEDKLSRQGYLRLDMNEGEGLPDGFVKRVLAAIRPEVIAQYPEYKKLVRLIARQDNLRPENICLSAGSDAAIKYIFDAYISRGDKVLLTDPTFGMYPVYCKMFAARAITVKYNPDFTFALPKFLAEIKPGVKLAIIVNPNNPTGYALPEKDLLAIIKKAYHCRTLVIVDEAYFYFYRLSVIKYVKTFKNLIVLRSFSKFCSMAALRLGYAAATPGIVDGLKKVKPTYDVNAIAVLFAENLLTDRSIIPKLARSFEEGKKYLSQKLTLSGIKHHCGSANFILIKCPHRTGEIVAKLKAKNILVAAGFSQIFLKDYIRVTVFSKPVMQYFWKVFWGIYKK